MKTLSFLKQILFGIILLPSVLLAEEVRYTDSWAEHGFTLQASESSNVRLIHSVNSFNFNAMQINGEEMTVINTPGVFLPNDEGAPNLPGEARYIAMPTGATPKLKIIVCKLNHTRE